MKENEMLFQLRRKMASGLSGRAFTFWAVFSAG